MRVFIVYNDERTMIEITDDQTVKEVKEQIRDTFSIGPDEGPAGAEGQEKKILTLHFMGSDLQNHWGFSDLGMKPGCTIKAVLRDELKPILYLYTVFNQASLPVLEKFNVRIFTGRELRNVATRKTGLPVGCFRMLNKEGLDIYDCQGLDRYDIFPGDTIRIETWDGWNDFLSLAILGFTSHVMAHLSNNEVVARYQMKVAMFIAAHYGHVDLAVHLSRMGIRADEPTGEHPYKQWCKDFESHIDVKKAPVHEAAEMGQLGVLRTFIHHNVCNVLARDGNNLTPLNIALRKKQKPCASFLLTKQWSKINYNKKSAIPLSIFVKMRRWADRSKDKNLVINGQWKSSIKNPRRHMPSGALVGYGVQLEGFTQSKMTSKPSLLLKYEEEREQRLQQRKYNPTKEFLLSSSNGLEPDMYFRSMGSFNTLKLPKVSMNKVGRMLSKPAQSEKPKEEQKDETISVSFRSEKSEHLNSETQRKIRPHSGEHERIHLPPIKNKHLTKNLSFSHQNLSTGNNEEPEFQGSHKTKSLYLSTRGRSRQKESRRKTSPLSSPSPTKHSITFTDHSLEKSKKDEKDDANKLKKKKKDKKSNSEMMVAKAQSADGLIPLPMISTSSLKRPFPGSFGKELIQNTLEKYEEKRGLPSRDYAIRCLAVANSFKEKPWLTQVHQAMTIAANGVRRTISQKPHLFKREMAASRSVTMGTPSERDESDHASILTC